jgi:hypothetical protein
MINLLQMAARNRERVQQQDNLAERERLIKAFEDMLPERVFTKIDNITSPNTDTKAILTVDEMWDSKKHGDDTMCCICFEVYSQETGLNVRQTPCGHIFHSQCLMEWVKSKIPKPDCPYCREPFVLKTNNI